jgi:DNA-binding GntR family transcriptional regulator
MDDPRPPYAQVADALRAEIRSGALATGDQLRSVAELAAEYGVAKMTVQRAIGELRDEGLVVSWQGRGTFVRDRDAADSASGSSFQAIMKRLDSMYDELRRVEDRVAALEAERSSNQKRER